uniref:N-acetyltransferase domain-containing protein n=2 Tax=Trichuris muris TaxID=70415 RepID=A0A5S6R601_TRIMR
MVNSTYKIVPANCRNHLNAIHMMIMELAEFQNLTTHVKISSDRLAKDHNEGQFSAFVAYTTSSDEKLVGYCLFYRGYSTFTGSLIILEDIYVQPEHRGHGLAKEMLKNVAQIAVDEGLARIQWNVLNWNERAIRFYKGIGAKDMTELEDLRSEAFECGDHLPRHSFLCDPDHLLSKQDAESVNKRLYELAVSTPCQCQRRSQCIAVGPDGNQFFVGFVTTIALVRKVAISSMDPADNQASIVAEKFARAVRNRWALGDCDNSALILVWESQSILHIATDRVTKLYVTEKEIHQIQFHLADLIRRKAYLKALELILDILRNEYSGMPEEHVDTGTLSLIVSIAVAGILGLIITGCVCAFRCCGNLRPDPVTTLTTAVMTESTTSVKPDSQRRESIFRQPLSRSPLPSSAPGQRYSPMPSLIASGGYGSKTYGHIDYSVV